jgi:putative ABC transport system permease protein
MTSPRLPRALLDRLIDPRLRDAVVGDLDELFALERANEPFRAGMRYWVRAAGVLIRLGVHPPARPKLLEPPPKGDGVMATFWTDMRHGARLFVTQPGYALAAALTLALAIGANTLIFTMANLLLVKPLPFADPDRLAWIFGGGREESSWRGPISLPEYAAFRERVPAIQHLSARQRKTFTMSDAGQAERVLAQVVIGDLHGLWGLQAVRGRTLESPDEQPGATPAVVLGHRYWQTKFGAREDAIGGSVRINGEFHTIVGVLSPAIELGNFAEIDIWLPYRGDPVLASRADRSWLAVGRLADGAAQETAHAQVAAVAESLAKAHPDTNFGRTARVGSTRDAIGSPNTWIGFALLITVVALLMLLACANIMNLLIARLIARRPELAVRTALGATHGRVLRQIVAESLVVGLVGGALGVALARGGLAAVHAIAYEPFFRQLSIDWRVLAFAAMLAFVAPLVFSIGPAMRMLRSDVRTALNEASTRSIGSRGAGLAQSALVVAQVALAVPLLVVAGLVVQSMQAITRVDVGYGVAGLLSTHIEIPPWKVTDDADVDRMRESIVQRVAAIPGARGVALGTDLPALHPPRVVSFTIGSAREDSQADRPTADLVVVSSSFFDVMQLPTVAGRGFTVADAASPARVAVVSQEIARRFFGDATHALGSQISLDTGDHGAASAATIIGVASDVRVPGLEGTPRRQLYMLDAHESIRSFYVIVRAERPEALASQLRAAIRGIDPDLPAYQLRTVAEAFDDEYSTNRLLSGLFAAFAIVAVLLATVGLYAVMSYAVSQRTQEIAVRMALGASSRDVAAGVMGHSIKLAALGLALGLTGAFALAVSARSALYGIGPNDAATYIAVTAVTAIAAFIASWIPMRRAMAIDPAQGIRQT